VKEKQYEVRLQATEDSHRQAALELREMLTAQQQMSAKYAFLLTTHSFLSFYTNCHLLLTLYLKSHLFKMLLAQHDILDVKHS